jgi:hypothetical protein
VADNLHPDAVTSEHLPREESEENGDEKILKEAHARFDLAKEAFSEIHNLALDDLKFLSGEQWDPKISQDRSMDGRPCLVINRIPQFLQQVTNDQRQNRPSIKVHPVDDDADVETAKIQQGLIRHIEYNSNADAAYDTAFDRSASSGFGYWRIITEYCDPMSFDQEILIKRIRNAFSVLLDPHHKEPDGSDAEWGFVIEDLSKDEYARKYPESKLADPGQWDLAGNSAPGWMQGKESARVAEYFYKDYKEVTLCLLTDGEVVDKAELEQHLSQYVQTAVDPATGEQTHVIAENAPTVSRERKSMVPAIKWCKLNAVEILEQTEWPGQWIPIVPVYGTELDIDGKLVLKGIVRDAKDPQRMLNYWKSAETEAIALAPRTPFIMAEGQDEGYEQDWATANRRNHAYLKYKPTSIAGEPAPPPQRNTFEPAVGAITNAAMQAADDLKATTGIYDAALGARSNESSGVAIQRRNMQAQTSNFHLVDNLTRSIKHTGRILIDLMPYVYDTERTARIIGEDGEQKLVKLNAPHVDEAGKPVIYDLSAGKYDVTVDVGPSYASKRQEAAASMMDLSKAYPPLMQIAGDQVVKNMDWPGAQEIAERLKKTIPPNLLDDPKSKNQQVPPQVQQQMQQMGQMIEQLTGKLHEAHDQLDTKRVEIESKERIEFKKLEVQLEIARAQIDAKDSLALLTHEINSISERMQLLNAAQPIDMGMPQDPQQFAPQPAGAPGADVAGMGAMPPTGGESPGSPMDGRIPHDDGSAT